ncbi:hypothetical protein JY651_03280 [Pyxidicoccus parkwayensis]|uniref:Secreted protein n=1 Tax=Pyxidicoccus parkwayensis TaxID=2813578 RepID=A0ABX7NYK7_9BACT|nr:hypothetical protein [Pyxidicoccus parkwaysis]QSQ24015.1 hypothetical protein JY651_03280 [Pyxidicoccus parkwaysis]
MRPSLLLCSLLLCFGCARSAEPMTRPDNAPSQSTDSGSPTAAASEPTPGTAPSDAGATGQASSALAAECRADADCEITLVPEGECCARMCSGRAVPVAEARALEARVNACREHGDRCVIPPCAPPRTRPVAVCTGGRCGVREVPREMP